MKNKIQLITYPDSLGSNLKDLYFVLNKYFKGIISGVHILPFFPSSGDRGFAPLNYLEVDEKFGTWEDIKKIAKEYDLMVDFMMNHISVESKYFKDFLRLGYESKYADFFLTKDKVFEKYDEEGEKLIYRPRPSSPFKKIQLPANLEKDVWITFSQDQIDIDWNSELTKKIMKSFILNLKNNHIKFLRLDAVGYMSKKAGTTCFFNEEVYGYINWVKDIVGKNITLLPEVHHHYSLQQQIAQRCDLTYDFQLTVLILYGLYFGDSHKIKCWMAIRPKNVVTVLDTHDGIGIVDVEDILSIEEIEQTREKLVENGGNEALRATGFNSDNLDIYQVNCTYYSALNNDDAYICARAIQFFVPGIPQVYYVGLFAGKNDKELLEKTNHGRDINRHYYSLDEIKKEVHKPVVKRLFELMKFRNSHSAFDGEFSLLESNNETLVMLWQNRGHEAKLNVNLKSFNLNIKYTEFANGQIIWKELDEILNPALQVKNLNL